MNRLLYKIKSEIPRNKLYFLTLLVCGMAGTACKKVVVLDPGPGVRASPVFYAFAAPDSPMFFYCWKTQLITDAAAMNPVADAQIRYFRSGIWVGTAQYDASGRYHTTAQAPSAGEAFRISIQHPDFNVDLPLKVPGKVRIANPDTLNILAPPGGRFFSISFELSDTAATRDFYRIYLLHTQYRFSNEAGRPDSVLRTVKEEISGSENAFLYNPVNRLNKTEILFTDEALNGLNKRLRFGTFNLPKTTYGGAYRTLGMTVVLERLDEALYRYYNDLALNASLSGSPVGQGGGIFSNVPGGYGVVGAYTADVFYIQF